MRIDFNPRSPSRERRADGTSTLSDTYISIHALQAESDDKDGYVLSFLLTISIHALQAESDFYHCIRFNNIVISIHALQAESDVLTNRKCRYSQISIHALQAESDFISISIDNITRNFNPRSPSRERRLPQNTWTPLKRFQSTLSKQRATFVLGP